MILRKRISNLLLIFSTLSTSLFGDAITDKIVEAKRIQKIDNIVEQENYLIKRIVGYVSATADLTPTRKEIQLYYNLSVDSFANYLGETCTNTSGYCNDNTTGGITINLDIPNNQIILGNVLGDSTKISTIESKRYKNSTSKSSNSETSSTNSYRKFAITDYDDLASVVNIVKTAQENTTNTVLQLSEPTSGDRTKMWLKPVGDGSFEANIFNPATNKWESRGAVSGNYNPSRGGTAPQITFYLSDTFDPKTTLGQKGWIVNVETKYGFSQYKYNGVEWVQVTAPDNKIFTYSDITDLMNNHMDDPLGSVISGVTIPNSTAVVEFTKYSKYWATKDGMYFVINTRANLPLTIKNGAKAWVKNGNLIYEYDSTINQWVAQFESFEYWKSGYQYLADGDYLKLSSEGKKYKYFQNEIGIAALDGASAYFYLYLYPKNPPSYYGLKENATVTDWVSSYHSVVQTTPNGNPNGSLIQNFVSTNGTFVRWLVNYANTKYLVMSEGGEYFWCIADYVSSNFKNNTAGKYYARMSTGTRTGNTFTIAGLPNALAGQKLYADRDGAGSFYQEIIEYTGQSNGTWTTSISGNPLVDYTFSSMSQAYPTTNNFQAGKVAIVSTEPTYYYSWSSTYWYNANNALKIINVPFGKQRQLGNMYVDYNYVTNDGQYYYSKVYPADTFVNAQKFCTMNYIYPVDNIPTKSITTAGSGSIAATGIDYFWTQDSTVAGTRIVYNGSNTKVASETEMYPYRCVRKYQGLVFEN